MLRNNVQRSIKEHYCSLGYLHVVSFEVGESQQNSETAMKSAMCSIVFAWAKIKATIYQRNQ